MTTHAKLSASGAHRWTACPGSVRMEDGLPDTTSEAAAEGTAAHEVAAWCLEREHPASEFPLEAIKVDGFSIDVSTEMREHVQTYLDLVAMIAQGTRYAARFFETTVSFDHVVPGGYGTADCLIADHDKQTLYVIDLKYGRTKVLADENKQLLLYALGAHQEFSYLFDIKTVVMTIVQPRLDHLESWILPVSELRGHANYFKDTSALALTPDAPLVPGESQCQFCKAAPTCPALAKLTLETAIADFSEEITPDMKLRDTDTLDNRTIAAILPYKKLIRSWLDKVEDHASAEIAAGREVPGYKLVQGRANRAWTDETEAEKFLKRRKLKTGEIFPRKIISPSGAEKLLGAAKKADLEPYITRPEGKPTLAPESDSRPALNLSAAHDFAELIEQESTDG